MKTHHLLHFIGLMVAGAIAYKCGVSLSDLAFLMMMAIVAYEVK